MPFEHVVPILSQALSTLDHLLARAEAHASAQQVDDRTLAQARLAPDMLNLAHQVEVLADGARGGLARLAGHIGDADGAPRMAVFNRGEDALGVSGIGLPALRQRVADAARDVQAMAARARYIDKQDTVTVTRDAQARVFVAHDFVQRYLVPNVFFHLSIAYAILRASGVPVGKQDFEGAPAYRLDIREA
jgi:uncharacterized protein